MPILFKQTHEEIAFNGATKKRNDTLRATGGVLSLFGAILHVAGAVSFCVSLVLVLLSIVSPFILPISLIVGGLGMFAAKEGERLISMTQEKEKNDTYKKS